MSFVVLFLVVSGDFFFVKMSASMADDDVKWKAALLYVWLPYRDANLNKQVKHQENFQRELIPRACALLGWDDCGGRDQIAAQYRHLQHWCYERLQHFQWKGQKKDQAVRAFARDAFEDGTFTGQPSPSVRTVGTARTHGEDGNIPTPRSQRERRGNRDPLGSVQTFIAENMFAADGELVSFSGWNEWDGTIKSFMKVDVKYRVNYDDAVPYVSRDSVLINLTPGTCTDPVFTIKKSTLPNAGFGLFTNVDIPAGESIGVYYFHHHPTPDTPRNYTLY